MNNPIVIAETKRVVYFGCLGGLGHFVHGEGKRSTWTDHIPGFPWSIGHLDSGLLKNGEHRDVYDGRVWWTCGGTPLWLAFYWWDNSVDSRGASNSGFYVQGFGHTEPGAAFEYACSVYPEVVARQRVPLVLQS